MDSETVKLRADLVRNQKLALEISKALEQFQLKVPAGKVVVWGPILVDKPETVWDLRDDLINGIPRPELLTAAYRFQDQYKLEKFMA